MPKKVTKTTIKVTVAACILALNLKKLLRSYEHLAAQHAEIPPPLMQESVESSISNFVASIQKHPTLTAIAQDVYERMTAAEDEIIKKNELDT